MPVLKVGICQCRKQEADAELYSQQKKAAGLVAMAEAEGNYIKTLLGSLGGSHASLRDYLMINRGIYQDMARVNAGAVQGLQPKISIWAGADAGAGSGGGAGAMTEVAGVYKMLPPLISTVQEQTGMLPPSWMGSMPDSSKK